SWLEGLIFGLDGALRRWNSVVEYTGDPTCILRIRVGRLERDLALADGTSGNCGERFIDLHLWNEQVPPMPKEGASIAWARRMHGCFQESGPARASFPGGAPELRHISFGASPLIFAGPGGEGQMTRLPGRFGFGPVPAASRVSASERTLRY